MSAAGSKHRRVVVTGMGLISPVGDTPEALWEAFESGRSGVGPLTAFCADSLPTNVAGEARDFTGDIQNFGPLEGEQKKAIRKGLKVMCRECQMGVAAAMRALASANLQVGKFDPERAGIVYGADYMLSDPAEFNDGIRLCTVDGPRFDYPRWGAEGMRQLTPLWLLKYLPNMPACHIAIYSDLRGPNNSITHREAAGVLAMGEAFRTIARGSADIMVAGATGTRVHPMKAVHATQNEELANSNGDPAHACRPFDLARGGMVLAEGAGAIVLEELDTALARGATVLAEIVGTSSSTVVDRRGIGRRAHALTNAMRGALRDAEMSPQEVGHINAHGLGTQSCDADEATAIREVFGDAADRLPVTAAKSYFGNLGAGSGIIETIASLLSLGQSRLFPTLNYETPDPACPVAVVRDVATPSGESFLKVSVTPQGQAGAIVFRRFA